MMLTFTMRLIVILIAIANGTLVGRAQELVLRGQMTKEAETVGLDISQLNSLLASGNFPEACKLVLVDETRAVACRRGKVCHFFCHWSPFSRTLFTASLLSHTRASSSLRRCASQNAVVTARIAR